MIDDHSQNLVINHLGKGFRLFLSFSNAGHDFQDTSASSYDLEGGAADSDGEAFLDSLPSEDYTMSFQGFEGQLHTLDLNDSLSDNASATESIPSVVESEATQSDVFSNEEEKEENPDKVFAKEMGKGILASGAAMFGLPIVMGWVMGAFRKSDDTDVGALQQVAVQPQGTGGLEHTMTRQEMMMQQAAEHSSRRAGGAFIQQSSV